VRGDEPCEDPPNAKMLVWDGVGFSGAHSSQCTARIKELTGGRFGIANTCLAAGDGSVSSQAPADTFVMKRLSRTSFVKLEEKPVRYHWCSVKGVH
jgi:hypothetical protein